LASPKWIPLTALYDMDWGEFAA